MRIVVSSFGSSGDFNPLLAIGAALVRRGAEVTFVANPFSEAKIHETGCRFVGAGEFFDVFAALEANPGYLDGGAGIAAIWRDLVAPSVRDIFPVMRRAIRETRADAVISHLLGFGGAWAAAEAGVRSIVVTTSSMGWLSRDEPPVLGTWRLPRPLARWLIPFARRIGGAVLGRVTSPLAVELGAPHIPDLMREADLNLGTWPEWFRPLRPDDPPRAHVCGFFLDPVGAGQALPEDLERFLDAGEAPVVAAFGSAASLHGGRRYEAIAQACGRIGRRCVLVGKSALGATSDGSTYRIAAAPYASLFPRAAAIVQHGGFGTCAEALRSGKPSLVTPFAFDQFDVAARVEAGRCGLWLKRGAENADDVAGALESLLANPTHGTASAEAAARIRSAPDGAEAAAELIVGFGPHRASIEGASS